MIDFSYETSKRKRKGIYSEQDIFESSHVFYPAGRGRAEAVFELSSVKNISVTRNLNLSKLSSVINGENGVLENLTMEQKLEVLFIDTPKIEIYMDANISKGCEISYRIFDDFVSSYPFTVTEKINNEVISTKASSKDGKYTTILTNEQILKLEINSRNTFSIEISTEGGVVTSRTTTFTRTNNKPSITINSYNSNSAKFIVSDLDNNLSKIECYLDDVLKETITTDLTTEKTINYELTDNAIHTLKIVATDTKNATVEKVLSISKEIIPPQEDASLSDISTKLVEIGEGFKNGKTSIINVLGLKNIEASLNNTLVELSEKIKTSFDSGDASLQDLTNKLTQSNNTISQLNTQINELNSKYKFAYSTDITKSWYIPCNFKPDILIYECWTTEGRLFVVLTPSIYACFKKSNSGWSIISSDYGNPYAYSENNINSYYGTVFKNYGFHCSAMPGDSLNDKYYFYYAIKCL
ncbi:TPA: hypothetical protein ACKOIF_001271 [Clostridioides difficile]